jgi:hypothetical protein
VRHGIDLLCRQSAVGCKLISLQLGDVVLMTTQAVLAALLALRSSAAGLKKPLKSHKGAKQPLLAKLPADLGFLGDLIPEAVSPTTANKSPHRPTQLQAAILPVDSSTAS